MPDKKKYTAGRGFNTGSGNYYDWSQNTDNSIQGNTFLFQGGQGGGGGGKKNKKPAGGTYGLHGFYKGRSELSGIGMDFDWRDQRRPAIHEGTGRLKALPGTKTAKKIWARGWGNNTPPQESEGPVQGAQPPGSQFGDFYEQNKNYVGGAGVIQGPSGMSPLGVSAYPRPEGSDSPYLKTKPTSFT